MPETPDFAKLASQLLEESHREDRYAYFERQLRQLWNARGAADITLLEAELATMMGATAAGPYVKNLDRALRKLDRS